MGIRMRSIGYSGEKDWMADDAGEFASFYEANFDLVFGSCRAFTSDPDVALEATQEAFARAFARWKRIGKHEWRLGWVITTAANQCRRAFRTRKPSVWVGARHIAQDRSDDRIDLLMALRRLPDRRRLAAVLFYVGDHSVAEVARVMKLSEGAVRSHLTLARNELRKHLGGSYDS